MNRNLVPIFIIAVAATLAACGDNGEPRVDPDRAGLKVYRHAMDQAPTSLDPVQAANVYANFVMLNAYDTLFRYKYLQRPYEVKL